MSECALEIRGLEKKFSGFTLGPLDLTVPKGAIYGLIGPNGAGKTTTIEQIFGLGDADGGKITAFGLDHRRDEVELKKRVSLASPENSYASWRSVLGAIRFIRGFYETWDHAYCDHLMKLFDLDAKAEIDALSFGSRTKLSLLMALAHRPDMVVLDEPTTGLDAVSKQRVFAELLSAVEDRNCTALISSHGLADLERVADYIGVIRDGRILLEGRTDEIVENFELIDIDAPDEWEFEPGKTTRLVERDGRRRRVLADKREETAKRFESENVRTISRAPVTLEELFVALFDNGGNGDGNDARQNVAGSKRETE